jgi:CubicO group peptidase (beta-lactamase class C family)
VIQIQGYCDPGFAAVKDAFAAIFADPQQRGAALCVQVGGATVLDLWAGTMDKDGQQAWRDDTILNLFSCTKALTAVAALQLVEQGRLELDVPLARYWPEFAAAGKEQVSLRQVLSHKAGLTALRSMLPAEALYDWGRMCAAVAAERPWWQPGSAHGYAPLTYGWLLGEVLRRVTGQGPGEAVVAGTTAPLGLDFHIGLDDAQMSRVAHLSRSKGNPGDAAAQRLFKVTMGEPHSMSSLAFGNPPSILSSGNDPRWRKLQQPAVNGHGNARSLAGFYAALLDGRLLGEALLAEMCREQASGADRTLLTDTRFGLGCWLDQPHLAHGSFGLGPLAFGHGGAGGSLGFADPERAVAFGFATNTLGPYVLMDPRAQGLARALGECL